MKRVAMRHVRKGVTVSVRKEVIVLATMLRRKKEQDSNPVAIAMVSPVSRVVMVSVHRVVMVSVSKVVMASVRKAVSMVVSPLVVMANARSLITRLILIVSILPIMTPMQNTVIRNV